MSPRRSMLAALAAALSVAVAAPAAAQADACTPPVASPVACENTKPGLAKTEWQVGDGDPTIAGFATRMSVDKGQPVSFKITSATANYRVDILRLGYYGGDGARMIQANLAPSSTAAQPSCLTEASSGLIDCGTWGVSLTWAVPATAVSGVYIARLVRNDTDGASIIPFVVRDDAAHSKVLLQTSDSTWAAYNAYGGNSLYQCQVACPAGTPGAYKAAYKVSYNKPFTTAGIEGPILFYSEYPMIRFMEANGYDVSYIAEVDVHRQGALVLDHDLFVSSGHDEYWSNTQRANVEAARDAGVNLAFFGGNDVFWKTRWEPSIAAGAAADRTLVSYKDTHFDAPTDPVEWTGTWRDPRFSPPGDGGRPENALMGQMFIVNGGTSNITVPSRFKTLRAWRNTDMAGLPDGQSLTLAPRSLGYEWDVDFDNPFRPAGTFPLSSTTVAADDVFTDYGTNTAPLTQTHTITQYRAPSGARVFSAGTVNWARGLDNVSNPQLPTDRNMRQLTANVFADMGVPATTLTAGLVAGTPSTDTTAPSSAITAPAGGSSSADGAALSITGTASDAGGGVVAAVEVSTDGGTTWHQATGTTSWSYAWTAHGAPTTRLRSRAVDDSGNLETPSAGVQVGVTCPCSIWGATTPGKPDSGDGNAVEVGVRFTSDTFGTVSGVRFYKSAANTGQHVGSLWTAGGVRVAQAVFSGESASGWQSVSFPTPVAVQPGTTYVASYHAPQGHYAATTDGMYGQPAPTPTAQSLDSPPLHAVANRGTSTNGVFAYGPTTTFPTGSFRATNYWVDVLFSPEPAPGQVTGVTATAGFGSAQLSWTAPTTGGVVASYEITPYIGATAQTPVTLTGSPPATSRTVSGLTPGTAYTFRVRALNPNGSGALSAASNAVTPAQPTAPDAPTGVVAQGTTQTSVDVRWTAPASEGGSAVSSSTVTPFAGSTALTPRTVAGAGTSTTVTGLNAQTQYTFRVTATNATGASAASAASNAASPESTIYAGATPTVAESQDGNAVELGVKFTSSTSGVVSGVRFHKAAANGGTHVGSLWALDGTRLAQATFTQETASGWQTARFATPVAITAGTIYIASYHAPQGRYSYTAQGLANAVSTPPLTAVASATSPNGVFAYGSAGTFPDGSWNDTDYGVDVVFQQTPVSAAPGAPTAVSAAARIQGAALSWTAPAGGPVPESYVVTPRINGVAQATRTVSGSPPATSTTVTGLTAGTSYTFTVAAANASGSGPASAPSNAVTPTATTVPSVPTAVTAQRDTKSAMVSWSAPASDGGRTITAYTITPLIGTTAQPAVTVGGTVRTTRVSNLSIGTSYTLVVRAVNAVGTSAPSAASNAVVPVSSVFEFTAPAVADAGDGSSVNLGVTFTAATDGTVAGLRFYKSTANTGTHVGRLWSATGALLAEVTFANESSVGWQSAVFAVPVAVTAGTRYVVSYLAPRGRYAATANGFSSAILNAPLTALADATSPNGLYAYAATSTFPISSYRATNYWVDVLFSAGGA